MPKCIVCGGNVANMDDYNANPLFHAQMVKLVMKHIDDIAIGAELDDMVVCELCTIAIINNGMEYMWDGKILLVWNKYEQEWFEPTKPTWKPIVTKQIVFKYDETIQKWVVKPR